MESSQDQGIKKTRFKGQKKGKLKLESFKKQPFFPSSKVQGVYPIQNSHVQTNPGKSLQSDRGWFLKSDKKGNLVSNPYRFPYSAIVYILVKIGNKKIQWGGTGFLIGPNLVMTCAHNIAIRFRQLQQKLEEWKISKYQYQNRRIQVIFAFGDIKQAQERYHVENCIYSQQYQSDKSLQELQFIDFALLQLNTKQNLTKKYGCFGFDGLWSENYISDKLQLYGYPVNQQQKQYKHYKYCFGQEFNVYQLKNNKKTLQYEAPTNFGQSGSPVFYGNKVVAIHTHNRNQIKKVGLKITDQIIEILNLWMSCITPSSKDYLQKWIQQKEQRNLNELYEYSINNNWQEVISLLDKKQGLRNITSLNLGGKKIFKIEKLYLFKSLIELKLSNNNITEIANLEEFKYLETLNLDSNKIQQIKNLQTLKSLLKLILNNNSITQIKNLQSLLKLEILGLHNNKIQKIQNIDGLKKLKLLDLFKNPLEKNQEMKNKIKKLKQHIKQIRI